MRQNALVALEQYLHSWSNFSVFPPVKPKFVHEDQAELRSRTLLRSSPHFRAIGGGVKMTEIVSCVLHSF